MRLLIFIGLKVLEIGGVVFGPYFLGMLTFQFQVQHTGLRPDAPYWMAGMISIIVPIGLLFVFVIAGAVICEFVSANWRYAGKLARKFKS